MNFREAYEKAILKEPMNRPDHVFSHHMVSTLSHGILPNWREFFLCESRDECYFTVLTLHRLEDRRIQFSYDGFVKWDDHMDPPPFPEVFELEGGISGAYSWYTVDL
jgi:hypothetical protein